MDPLNVRVALWYVVSNWCPSTATFNVEKLIHPDTPYCLNSGPSLSALSRKLIYQRIYGASILSRSYAFIYGAFARVNGVPFLIDVDKWVSLFFLIGKFAWWWRNRSLSQLSNATTLYVEMKAPRRNCLRGKVALLPLSTPAGLILAITHDTVCKLKWPF